MFVNTNVGYVIKTPTISFDFTMLTVLVCEVILWTMTSETSGRSIIRCANCYATVLLFASISKLEWNGIINGDYI